MNTWKDRHGQIHDIGNMETSHILNSLNMRLRQMATVNRDSIDAQSDFADNFGMDGELAGAVGLCKDEFALMEQYTQDIGKLAAELGKRNIQLSIKESK